MSNCLECANETACQTCDSLYMLQEGQCVSFAYGCNIANCKYCEAVDQCGECQLGYYPTTMFSQQTQTMVSYCSNDWNNFVDEIYTTQNCLHVGVLSEYGIMDTYLTKGCVICQENFMNVGGFCVAKVTNYTCNVENCQWCSAPNYCGQCQAGYTVLRNTGGICMKDYSPIPECQLLGANQFDCAMCAAGYTLNNDLQLCVPVNTEISCTIVGCVKCLSNNVCEECASDLTLEHIPILNVYKCVNKPSCEVPDCSTCGQSEFHCAVCAQGYQLTSNHFC